MAHPTTATPPSPPATRGYVRAMKIRVLGPLEIEVEDRIGSSERGESGGADHVRVEDDPHSPARRRASLWASRVSSMASPSPSRCGPKALHQIESEVAASRFFDDLALALDHPGRPHLDRPEHPEPVTGAIRTIGDDAPPMRLPDYGECPPARFRPRPRLPVGDTGTRRPH